MEERRCVTRQAEMQGRSHKPRMPTTPSGSWARQEGPCPRAARPPSPRRDPPLRLLPQDRERNSICGLKPPGL